MSPLANITRADLEPIWNRREIPLSRIASSLGVTVSAVGHKAKRLGLPPRRGWQGDGDLFRRMWLAGVKQTDMAAHLGFSSRSAVSARAAKMGLPPRPTSTGHVIPLSRFWEMEMVRKMRGASQ